MEKEQHRFNLEIHLLEWKRGFAGTSLNKEDVEELSQHLRDHFDELTKSGHSAIDAWYTALQAIGPHKAIVKEFDKVWYIFLRNTFTYYMVAFLPGFLILLFARNDSTILVWMFGSYLIVYRTFIDFFRLRSRNAIDKNGIWKLLVPGGYIRYFRALYF